MQLTLSDDWTGEFRVAAQKRRADGEPDWSMGARLHPAVVRSVQRFQVGEAGDGANLIRAAARAGDEEYAAAVRMFVAEEQNHARLLASLLTAAGAPTITGHWTDAVFIALRRALGLRLELMVLLIAEVIALRYYRALRDGTPDPLTRTVAARILADEERHVPFHCRRLRQGFRTMPRFARRVIWGLWRLLHFGATVVVAWDHGPALRRLALRRRDFVRDANRQFSNTLTEIG